MSVLSLSEMDALLDSPQLRQLEVANRAIPVQQREGLLANLGDIDRVILQLRRHRRDVHAWAAIRAEAETQKRENDAALAERQLSQRIHEVVEDFARAGVDLGQ